MSEAVSALKEVKFDGIAHVEESGLQGMITLRGDLSVSAVRKAATGASGTAMPGQGQIALKGDGGLAWMSPDELLVLCPYDKVGAVLEKMNKTLAKSHALAADVSDARGVFRVSGPSARDVMAKLCPVDFAPDAFKSGQFRRTRMAQVPAAIWLEDENSFRIICFRSAAQYVFDLLKVATQPGSGVGYF